MILNSKNNNYIVKLPKNFIYPNIQSKYNHLIKRMPLPYDDITDYLNASIQQITLPSVSADNVDQILYEDNIQWKSGYRLGRIIDKNFSLTFKSYEGYINYWIMFEQLQQYLSYDNKNEFLPDIILSFLDQHGFELISIIFKQIIMKSISELELNFSSNTPEFQSFTCEFHFNYFEIKHRLD